MTIREANAADWRAIYRDLRAKIDSGELLPGSPLPTIAALAKQTGLTRHGARRVLERLRDEGRTQSWQGVGFRVAETVINYQIDGFPRWGQSISRMGLENTSCVIASRSVRASRDVALHMRLKTGARIYQAEILRLVDQRPTVLARGHFPMGRFEGILDEISKTGSVAAALAQFGVREYRRTSTQVEARLPTQHEALVLNIPSNQPVLVSTGVNTDPEGAVVELALSVCRADCIRFMF